MLDTTKTGKRISVSRQDKGLTQDELASKLGITPQAVSRWERGNSMPDIEFLLPLSQLLNIPLEDLLTGGRTSVESLGDKKQPSVISLMQIDEIRINLGHNLISLANQLLENVFQIRKEIALKHGIILPLVRICDDEHLDKNIYEISIMGKVMAENKAYAGRSFAFIEKTKLAEKHSGIEFDDPISGKKAVWIPSDEIITDKLSEFYSCNHFVSNHLQYVITQNLSLLITREMAKFLTDAAAVKFPLTAEESVPKLMSYGDLAKLIKALLSMGKSVQNMYTILDYICGSPQFDSIDELAGKIAPLL